MVSFPAVFSSRKESSLSIYNISTAFSGFLWHQLAGGRQPVSSCYRTFSLRACLKCPCSYTEAVCSLCFFPVCLASVSWAPSLCCLLLFNQFVFKFTLNKKLSTEVYSWWALPTARTSVTTPTTKIISYIGSKGLWSPQLQGCPDTQGQRTPPYNQGGARSPRSKPPLGHWLFAGYTSQVQRHAQFTLVPQSMPSAADFTILGPHKNLSQF